MDGSKSSDYGYSYGEWWRQMTLYCVTIRIHASGLEKTLTFLSMTERNIAILDMDGRIDVVREFLAMSDVIGRKDAVV